MKISKLINASVLFFGLIYGCSEQKQKTASLPYYDASSFTPLWIEKGGDLSKLHTISDFNFTDQEGNIIRLQSLQNKIHVASFFFTSCSGICTTTQSHFKILQDSFLNDPKLVLLSFSVTPWMDSVAELKNYANEINADPTKWHLLTGSKDSIYDIARNSYFAEMTEGENKSTDEFLHTEHFILVDGQMHIRGIYNGTLRLELQRLISDIRTLEAEGS